MNINLEQFAAANRATVDSLLAVANTALASAERIAELNLSTVRSAVEDSAASAKAVIGARDAQEAMAIQIQLAQPAIERAVAYSRSVYEITAQTQAELSQLLQEQFSDFQNSTSRLLEQAIKTAPVGSEDAFMSIQKAFASAYTAFGNMNAATRKTK